MKKISDIAETLIGLAVIGVAVAFVAYVLLFKKERYGLDHYHYIAHFERIDGLSTGSDVKMSGVPVGYIDSVAIDSDSHQAKVVLSVDRKIAIPADSSAEVASDGLLGGKYISITPGSDSKRLANKGQFAETEPSVSFEKLLNKFLFTKPEQPATKTSAPPVVREVPNKAGTAGPDAQQSSQNKYKLLKPHSEAALHKGGDAAQKEAALGTKKDASENEGGSEVDDVTGLVLNKKVYFPHLSTDQAREALHRRHPFAPADSDEDRNETEKMVPSRGKANVEKPNASNVSEDSFNDDPTGFNS